MRLKFKASKITIDTAGVLKEIKPYVEKALKAVEDEYIAQMKKELDMTVESPKEWADTVKELIGHIREEAEGTCLSYICGVDISKANGLGDWMKALVIQFGMGLKSTVNPRRIMAGPQGRIVWDNNLDKLVPSKVKEEHELPWNWYHGPNPFIDNATKIMESMFNRIVEDALQAIPRDIIRRHIKVTVGR